MGSPQAELSLDYKPNNAYPLSQKPIGDRQQADQTQKLQEFLSRLEEERLKIEVFKRELPLCMQLLNNAMETYRQQLETCQTSQGGRPVLEEFIPLKNASTDGSQPNAGNASSEKASWMVSAQLWSPASDAAAKQQAVDAPTPKDTERAFDASPKFALDTKQRKGGAFLPFSKDKIKTVTTAASPRALPDLALASSEKEMDGKLCGELENGAAGLKRDQSCIKGAAEQGKGSSGASNPAEGQTGTQTHRKARRCWSPDLHRRFVNALQILGGSQVATPKQIRELMKVDGLTNDEVKSHLQKYRLHTRRPLQPPQASTTAAPQLVVLGSIWVPPEYATSAAAAAAVAAPGIYGAHPAPPHYCPSPVPHDFYRPPPTHHHLHPPIHRGSPFPAPYKGRLGSPISDVRSGGERSESIEEGEEGEEREEEEEEEEEEHDEDDKGKALVAARAAETAEDGGGGSDVALKF